MRQSTFRYSIENILYTPKIGMLFAIFLIIFLLFVTVLCCIVAYIEYERRRVNKTLRHIPSVQEFPIIGSKVIFSFFEMTEYKRYIKELVYEPVLKMFVGPKCVLILSDPDALQEVLNNPAFSDRPYLMRFFPYLRGIVSSECKWQTFLFAFKLFII